MWSGARPYADRDKDSGRNGLTALSEQTFSPPALRRRKTGQTAAPFSVA